MSEQITIKLPSIDEVEIHLIADYCDIPVRGNAAMTGDDAADKKTEDYINRRLARGQVWAWADVEIYATWKGIRGESDYLGGCCYKNESDFIKNSGYYDDMKKTAYNSLIDEIKSLA